MEHSSVLRLDCPIVGKWTASWVKRECDRIGCNNRSIVHDLSLRITDVSAAGDSKTRADRKCVTEDRRVDRVGPKAVESKCPCACERNIATQEESRGA